jgi:hypothetical protein
MPPREHYRGCGTDGRGIEEFRHRLDRPPAGTFVGTQSTSSVFCESLEKVTSVRSALFFSVDKLSAKNRRCRNYDTPLRHILRTERSLA